MITRRQMLQDAAGLVADADDQYHAIQLADPSRAGTARVILCDAVRVHMLLSTRLPFRCIGREIKARLIRASLLSQALNGPLQ